MRKRIRFCLLAAALSLACPAAFWAEPAIAATPGITAVPATPDTDSTRTGNAVPANPGAVNAGAVNAGAASAAPDPLQAGAAQDDAAAQYALGRRYNRYTYRYPRIIRRQKLVCQSREPGPC